MSLLAPPATGSPHDRHTAAAAQRALCSPDKVMSPPGPVLGLWWAGEEEEVRAQRKGSLTSPCRARLQQGRWRSRPARAAAEVACPGSRTPGALPGESAWCCWFTCLSPCSPRRCSQPFPHCRQPAWLRRLLCARQRCWRALGISLGESLPPAAAVAAGSGGFISRAHWEKLSSCRSLPEFLCPLPGVWGREVQALGCEGLKVALLEACGEMPLVHL